MERSEFAQLALQSIEKARPGDVCVLDDEKFIVVSTNSAGESSVIALANFYEEWMFADADAKRNVLERIARAARYVDGQESLEEVRVLLVPRLRPRRYFEIDAARLASDLSTKDAKRRPLVHYYKPFAEHLGIGLAIDRPEHIQYVTTPSQYTVEPEELHAIALANLKRATKTGLEKVQEGLWLGSWSDEYAAERMLMPELFTELGVDGEPVVFLPGAERIYVVGSNDEASIKRALALVDDRLDAPRGILGFGFVLTDGAWQLFAPRGEIGRELGRRLCHHLADAYAVQREALEAKFEGDEDAPYVASVLGIADEEGVLQLTVTSWGADIRAFLPRAQVIGVGRLGGDRYMVPWEDVMELAGEHLVPVPDLYPPRWETQGFPDDATLEKLRKRSIEMADTKRKRKDAGDRARRGAETRARLAHQRFPVVDPEPAGASSQARFVVAAALLVLAAAAVMYVSLR